MGRGIALAIFDGESMELVEYEANVGLERSIGICNCPLSSASNERGASEPSRSGGHLSIERGAAEVPSASRSGDGEPTFSSVCGVLDEDECSARLASALGA